MSALKRSVWTFGTGLAQSLLTMAVGLVATPYLLRWLGEARFGAFRALSDCLGYLALLELGRGGALVPLLLRAIGQKDDPSLRSVLAAGFKGYTRTTVFMLAGGLVIFVLAPLVVPLSQGAWELRAAVLLSMVGTLVTPVAPVRLFLDAMQRGYFINAINAVQSLLVTLLSLTFAWRGLGVPGQAIATSTGAIAAGLLLVSVGLRTRPDLLRTLVASSDPEAESALRRLSWPTVLLQASSQVSVLSDNLVISSVMGPTLVVPFSVTQRLIGVAGSQIKGVSTATSAQLASMYFAGDHPAFRSRFLELLKVVTVLCFAALGPVFAFNAQFISRWLGPSRFGGEVLSGLACAAALALVIMNLMDLTMGSTGHVRERVPLATVSGVVNVAASILLTIRFRLWGPILGTLVALITVNAWWYPRLLKKLFGLLPSMLLAASAPATLLGLVYTTFLWQWAHLHHCRSWLDLLAEMTLGALFFLALSWLIVFSKPERAFWHTRLFGRWARPPT